MLTTLKLLKKKVEKKGCKRSKSKKKDVLREEASFKRMKNEWREREKTWFLINILFLKHIFIPLLPRIILVQTVSQCINLVFVFISSYRNLFTENENTTKIL